MKTFVLVALYLAFGLCGVAIALGGVVLATIDPYSFEDMSRGGICGRSGDVAPQCSLPRESADKVVDAFLSCSPRFFQVLKEERAAFGRAEVRLLPYDLLDSEEPRTSVVTFDKPVEARALRLVGYTQAWSQPSGAGSKEITWGFRVIGRPDDIERAIEAHQRSNGKSTDAAFTIVPKQDASLPGTYIGCSVAGETNGMEDLPHVLDLFLSQSIGTKFAESFDLFVASAEKTIARLWW